MNKKNKELLLIVGLSILLAGIMALLCALDPDNVKGKLAISIFLTIWTFSVPPAYAFVFSWLNKKSFFEGATIGSRLGIIFGFFAFFIPIIIAPALMIFYYHDILKKSP